MADLEKFLAAKFDTSAVKPEYTIVLDNFLLRPPFMIIGDKLDLVPLKEKINKLFHVEETKFTISEINLDSEKDLSKSKSSIIRDLEKDYHLIFTSNAYLRLIDICGLETLRSHFNRLYLAKLRNAGASQILNKDNNIECSFQRPIINWAYKKMLEGEMSLACDVLLFYLELFGPRDLSFLDRMRYISVQDRTSLPSGDIASVLNSGAKTDISWFFYKDAVTQEMKRENSKLELPFWNTQDPPDKKIVFRRVHSPTDEILYASIFKDLIEDGLDFLVEADKRLIDLFSRSFPEVEVVPRLEKDPHPRFLESDIGYQANYSDPFELYRNDINKFIDHSGYLLADPEKVKFWDNYFAELNNKPRIGISWRSQGKNRFMDGNALMLNQWAAILSMKDFSFINLQYGHVDEDIAWASENLQSEVHVIKGADIYDDLDGLAAIISSLDLVISTPNINAHMAGALGTPLWEMIPSHWHLLLGQNYFPFYPHARIFDLSAKGLENIANLLIENMNKSRENIDPCKGFRNIAHRVI